MATRRLISPQVFCWGWGEHGNLGSGRRADEASPFRVPLPPAVAAAAGPLRVACGGASSFLWRGGA